MFPCRPTSRALAGTLALLCLTAAPRSLTAAEFLFVNLDGPGEGLNDPTPVAAVGGNSATTLGAQRLAVFEEAGRIWGQFLVSSVPIRVAVQFTPQSGTVLGGAAPIDLFDNFSGAPEANTWYAAAQANSLAGVDLAPSADDIDVEINSNASLYLGFDTAPGGQNSLLDIMLHELGHGLGFAAIAYFSGSGNFLSGQPDAYSRRLFDTVFETGWPSLSSTQRLQSSVGDPDLVWTGPSTTAAMPFQLNEGTVNTTRFRITAPASVERTLAFLPATFGPALSSPLTASVVVADDGSTAPGAASPTAPGTTTDACQPILNTAAMAGNIALIRRGGCFFDDKVFRAQQAGAVAVIIANNSDTGLVSMSGDGLVDGLPVTISIPSIFVSQADGDAIEAAVEAVEADYSTVSQTQIIGSQNGRLRLYAPATLSPGSSISHWTTAAQPSLLMEPFITPGLMGDLDLTLTALKDIGWRIVDIPYPHLTYEVWAGDRFQPSDLLTGPLDDLDFDGFLNIEEYFFATDPRNPASGGGRSPRFDLSSGNRVFTFTRATLSTDLEWTVERSIDLGGFVDAEEGVDYEVLSRTDLDSSSEEIVLRILTTGDRGFFRLRIRGS